MDPDEGTPVAEVQPGTRTFNGEILEEALRHLARDPSFAESMKGFEEDFQKTRARCYSSG